MHCDARFVLNMHEECAAMNGEFRARVPDEWMRSLHDSARNPPDLEV